MNNSEFNNHNSNTPISNGNSSVSSQYTSIFDPNQALSLGQPTLNQYPQQPSHSQVDTNFLPMSYSHNMLANDNNNMSTNQASLVLNNPMMMSSGQNPLPNQMPQIIPSISSANSTPSASRHNSNQINPNGSGNTKNSEINPSTQINQQLSGLVGSLTGPNKNWPYKILGELRDFLHVLSPSGRFLFCSPSCLEITGYSTNELVGQNITNFIHVDDVDSFIRDFNLSVHSKSLNMFYRFRKKDDKFTVFEVNGHPYFQDQTNSPKCFFMMARPYPSKAIGLLDSFLELKLENELLTKKLERYKQIYDGPDKESGGKVATSSGISNEDSFEPLPQLRALVGDSTPSTEQAPKKRSKKSQKIDHICTDCGTSDSPEWRKGPQGPKTLCNACGLRYSKLAKKLNQQNNPSNNNSNNNNDNDNNGSMHFDQGGSNADGMDITM